MIINQILTTRMLRSFIKGYKFDQKLSKFDTNNYLIGSTVSWL